MRRHDQHTLLATAPAARAAASGRAHERWILAMQQRVGNSAVAGAMRAVQREVEMEAPVEDGGGAVATGGACTPTPMPRAQFLQQPGATVQDFGRTTIVASNATFPAVVLDDEKRLQPTSAALPPIASCYVDGTFTDPGDTVKHKRQEGGLCKEGVYPRRWQITPNGARLLAAAEQEHCDDFHRAFDLSLRRFADAVNADAGRRFPDDATAAKTLARTTGTPPGQWPARFFELLAKSKVRDDRGWHTPVPHSLGMDEACTVVRAEVNGASLPRLGVGSAEVVK